MSFRIERYYPDNQSVWDDVVKHSFNATFLHLRDYMDYHAERFDDFSLIFYHGNEPVALLPAHRRDGILFSHLGLTYGGWLWKRMFRLPEMEQMATHALAFLKDAGMEKVHIREVPLIYWHFLSEQNRYLYSRFGSHAGTIFSWIIDTRRPLSSLLNADRRRSLRKTESMPWQTHISEDWEAFWHLLEQNLALRHGAKPVHSLEEIQKLHRRFPRNILLYALSHQGRMLAGTVIYRSPRVVRFQYTAGTTEPDFRPAIDRLAWDVMQYYYPETDYLDWGPSYEPDGSINEGLVYWKQSLGAVPWAQYKWDFDV